MRAAVDALLPAPPMKLADALAIASRPAPASASGTYTLALVCSFTPLHLQTFLHAGLRQRFPTHEVDVTTGVYDDMAGTLRNLRGERIDAAAIVLEWFDLDARLGLRRLGGWSPSDAGSILDRAETCLAQLRHLIGGLTRVSTVAISLPTLPLPPVFSTAGWQMSAHELRLRELLWAFAAGIAQDSRVRIVSDARLQVLSPPAERASVKSTWMSGFPYRTVHAARLAELLVQAVDNRPPKKGLITDLDNTLWHGVVGDDGVEQISWDLDHHSQAHGVYQQLLGALADAGILVAVASKNDSGVVDEAFDRPDLLLRREQVFPFAVTWGSKAQAVARVLETWHVGADSVVFVDDNPTELAEVAAAHPDLECLQFPTGEPDAVLPLIAHLRDLFGKANVSDEDRIRLESLRTSAAAVRLTDDGDGYSEELLEQAEPQLVLDFVKAPSDARPLELINKTNQFNLNGRRISAREWAEWLDDPQTFLLTASYADRFGPLGKIAVVAGRADGSTIAITTWVMSCRAFARRIEHRCLAALFERFDAQAARFDYLETPRNGPLTRFLRELTGAAPAPGLRLEVDSFRAACPRLFHRVTLRTELEHA